MSDGDLSLARAAGLTDGEIVETVTRVVQNLCTNRLNYDFVAGIDFPAVNAA